MDLKKPLTFDEQLDKLAAHGMIITDREKAKDNCFSRKQRIFCSQFEVYGKILRDLSRQRICATGCCTNSMGSQYCSSG